MIPLGKSSAKIAGLDVHFYKPAASESEDSLLVLGFHGIKRDAETFRDFGIPISDAYDVIFAVPHFDALRFSNEVFA